MLRLRRHDHDVRMDMTPMMDVIFLLLTFFMFASILIVPPMVLPAKLQPLVSAKSGEPVPAVTISIDRQGQLFCDRDPIALEQVVPRLREIKSQRPETVIYIAAEAEGDSDRLPAFLQLYDELAFAGLEINLVGRKAESSDAASNSG